MFGTHSWKSSCRGRKTDLHLHLARQAATLVRSTSQPTPHEVISSMRGTQVRHRPISWCAVRCSPCLSSTHFPKGHHWARASHGTANTSRQKDKKIHKGRIGCPSQAMGRQRAMTINACRRLVYSKGVVSCFPQASQNVVAAAALLDKLPRWKLQANENPPRDPGPSRSCCATTRRELHVLTPRT